jgi:hypothetical protein
MLIFDIFDLPRKIKGAPLYKAAQLGIKVGTEFGQAYATQIEEQGAASGPIFSQEMFDYEISAIRMGAQI